MKNELWLCRVHLKFLTHMVLKYDGVDWWQYCPPGFFNGIEGWVGVNFDFDPIKKIENI